jgi:cardiolipin synthase
MSSRAFNLPNMLTYARILAVPLIVLCFYLEGRIHPTDWWRWAAVTIFIVASITDYLDGYLARIWKQTSNIGKMLDPIADKLLVSAALLLLAFDRTIDKWSLAALKVSVPVTQLAKWKTAMQLVAVGFLLAGPAGDKVLPYTTEIGLALLWASAIVTLYTGYDYFRAGLKHIIQE